MRIGIDIGGTKIRMGIVDGGMILRKAEALTNAQASEDLILDNLCNMIRQIMNTNIRGIGIGVPSVVNAEQGIVYNTVNIPSWKKVYLKDILEREFRVPVFVNNESNCFAFGERYYGEGTSFRNIVCVTLGTGVGAGIIINDELYNGNNTGAGEIGSLPYLDADYEYYCSRKFFDRNNVSGRDALNLALMGDTDMISLWEELGGHIGNLIKAILFTYDPQAIILGGGLSAGYQLFSEKMFEVVSTFPYPETLKRVRVLLSQKEDIYLLGAAALVV
ncbi:MAG: ROK family protein [Prevotella sp.]|jgi:glucokinase|nr:ROK family protein [Prevotella sp.]